MAASRLGQHQSVWAPNCRLPQTVLSSAMRDHAPSGRLALTPRFTDKYERRR